MTRMKIRDPNYVYSKELCNDLDILPQQLQLLILRGDIPTNHNEPIRKNSQERTWLRSAFYKKDMSYEIWKTEVWCKRGNK